MIDILLPKGNENELLAMAKRLGHKKIILAYEKLPEKPDSIDKQGLEVYFALLSKKNSQITKKMISLFQGKDGAREFLERSGNIVFDMEIDEKSDMNYFRNSGLNQVICHIANEKCGFVGLSFNSIINSEKQRLPILIGRMKQNIRFCKKFKVNALFFSFAKIPFEVRARGELDGFSRSLGMGQKEIIDSKKALAEIIDRIYVRKDYDLPLGMRTIKE